MKYRQFGNTELRVSEIGLGCASLGGGLYHRDDRESINTLLQAFDSGINFYDTSDVHSLGRSQELIGEAFKGRRDRVVIASKTGILYSPLATFTLKLRSIVGPVGQLLKPFKKPLHRLRASQKRYDYSPNYLRQAVERSLKYLNTDYLDLFQVYNPPTSVLIRGDFCEIFEKLKKEGKIRYYGVACATVGDSVSSLLLPGISAIQVIINLLDQEPIKKLLPKANDKKIAIVANHPRAMGLLTNTHRDIMGDLSNYDQSELNDRYKRARDFEFLIKPDRTLAQASIKFVLQLHGVSVAIPRAVNRGELYEMLGSLTAPLLTSEELEMIKLLSRY